VCSGVDCPELLAQLCQRKQPPIHLLWIRGIARPNTSLQLVEAIGLSLGKATAVLAPTLAQGSQEGRLRIDRPLEAEAAGHGGIRLAGVAQCQGLFIGTAPRPGGLPRGGGAITPLLEAAAPIVVAAPRQDAPT
jgi:hypothetical protein